MEIELGKSWRAACFAGFAAPVLWMAKLNVPVRDWMVDKCACREDRVVGLEWEDQSDVVYVHDLGSLTAVARSDRRGSGAELCSSLLLHASCTAKCNGRASVKGSPCHKDKQDKQRNLHSDKRGLEHIHTTGKHTARTASNHRPPLGS